MVNTAIIFLTSVLVFITVISAFISGHEGLDLFFVLCVLLICGSHLTLVSFDMYCKCELILNYYLGISFGDWSRFL